MQYIYMEPAKSFVSLLSKCGYLFGQLTRARFGFHELIVSVATSINVSMQTGCQVLQKFRTDMTNLRRALSLSSVSLATASVSTLTRASAVLTSRRSACTRSSRALNNLTLFSNLLHLLLLSSICAFNLVFSTALLAATCFFSCTLATYDRCNSAALNDHRLVVFTGSIINLLTCLLAC